MPFIGTKIRYQKDDYAVIEMNYKDLKLPIVLDWEDYQSMKEIDKSWKCHKNGFVSCQHKHDGSVKEVFLHELVMVLKNQENESDGENEPILHINRIGLDNRRVNLEYRSDDPSIRNTKKKKRTIVLPEDSGIDPDDIPTYVWYLKPHGTHGARFSVEIGDIKWKSTASRYVSLEDKLDEAKEYLRNLQDEQPELFEERSMNGDYSKIGAELSKQYQAIIHKAGYDNITIDTSNDKTAELIGKRKRKQRK